MRSNSICSRNKLIFLCKDYITNKYYNSSMNIFERMMSDEEESDGCNSDSCDGVINGKWICYSKKS